MSNGISYTTEEIAKLLKISKLTVYALIRKGELPAYKVGKQMRVDAADLEAYKRGARQALSVSNAHNGPSADAGQPASIASAGPSGHETARKDGGQPRPVIITGQDLSLDMLSRHLERRASDIRPLRSYASSLDSLIALYEGRADIVSAHLLDGDTGEYNLPYVRKLLVGQRYLVIHLLSRPAGLYVRKGNPKNFRTWKDLAREGVRLVNRERGAGARVLLDEQLRLCGADAEAIAGYAHEESSHLAVAGKVADGSADVGVGAANAAGLVGGIDFIPLQQERCDLVVLNKPENGSWIGHLLEILSSDAFRGELRAMHGYDSSSTGEILWRS